MKRTETSKAYTIPAVLGWLLFTLGVALISAMLWELESLNVGISEIIFTLTNPLDGADSGIAESIVRSCLPVTLLFSAGYAAVLIRFRGCGKGEILKLRRPKLRLHARALICGTLALVPVATWILAGAIAEKRFQLSDYVKTRMDKTTIYEDYYVRPSDTEITARGKPKNLICIYLESMETTYTSYDQGGFQKEDLIPNLRQLAYDNLSFGTKSGARLGGADNIYGAFYTMGALMASTSGVPCCVPMEDPNTIDEHVNFAAGLENLGTILESQGYRQEFLCGSDATFGGRRTYFTSHGNYSVYDYLTAKKTERIPQDYKVWWGFEDKILYKIAQEQLLTLADSGEPFNFTMLTADTHFTLGYVCDECDTEKYGETSAAVVECADRQIAAFIEWCRQQSFYEDTLIVILGDHPRMDNYLVDGVDSSQRLVYNCFINPAEDVSGLDFSDRRFTQVDMFPTILAAMGFDIRGDRLGMGANLLSDQPTLIEQFGFDWVNTELQKTSVFYERNFY